ncbi:MAG: 2OG-Fe(II) oxygenase [Betaproteobacteria bacterium]|nr:2OG-Fe(II) oxygenase [Betaproteobacteria bacterium]
MGASLQGALFEPIAQLPHRLVYQPDFISAAEEAALLAGFADLPFNQARFQQYIARRRVVRYGEGDYPASYGQAAEIANPSRPFPELLMPLRRRVAAWRGIAEADFVHALVTEYQSGTPIGWHSDAPHFKVVVGISLKGAARMRFRPYSAQKLAGAIVEIELAPRSAYVMQDEIRWDWQHQIPPTRELRYSITFRTLADEGTRRGRRTPGRTSQRD